MSKWSKPNENISGLDLAFGPKKISDFLPSMAEIPKEFHSRSGPWQNVISQWFFGGLKQIPKAKEGIDQKAAISHVKCVLSSFEPKHEHKESGCAYLMSLWFELPPKEQS